jgi:tryptophan synthase alpha chain
MSDSNKQFITYIMAGDPDLETTRKNILALQEGGATLIELGIPFSDPVAEGIVIQEANLRAFKSGTTLEGIFTLVDGLKSDVKIPLLFMTYVNLLFNYGYDRFFKRCADIGISGVILPDVPFEESDEITEFADKYGIDVVYLLAPTSQSRVAEIAKKAKLRGDNAGFIYLVSSMGVTGVRTEITTDLRPLVAEIKKHTDTPVAIGFGISSGEQARDFCEYADGFIVGSALVKIVEKYGENAPSELKEKAKELTRWKKS